MYRKCCAALLCITVVAFLGCGGKTPSAGKVYIAPIELFGDMPKSVAPKRGSMGSIERVATLKWLRANVVGRTIEWTMTIKEVRDSGNDPFDVTFYADHRHVSLDTGSGLFGRSEEWMPFGNEFTLDDQRCQAVLHGSIWMHVSSFFEKVSQSIVTFTACPSEDVVVLRKFKGKNVVFRAKIIDIDLKGDEISTLIPAVPIILKIDSPSVDGFVPKSLKPKEKK